MTGRIRNGPARTSEASGIRNGPASGRTHAPDVQALDVPFLDPLKKYNFLEILNLHTFRCLRSMLPSMDSSECMAFQRFRYVQPAW